jgi:hypothetical protein
MSEHFSPQPDDLERGVQPENLADQKAIEAANSEMEQAAGAEWDRIDAEIHAGRSAQEILDELGGPAEAARIIGEYYANDLQELVAEENMESQISNQKGEK